MIIYYLKQTKIINNFFFCCILIVCSSRNTMKILWADFDKCSAWVWLWSIWIMHYTQTVWLEWIASFPFIVPIKFHKLLGYQSSTSFTQLFLYFSAATPRSRILSLSTSLVWSACVREWECLFLDAIKLDAVPDCNAFAISIIFTQEKKKQKQKES